MPDNSQIQDLLKSAGGFTELYEMTTFEGYRKGKHVTVRILDQGPNCPNPQIRFTCEVKQDDGKKAISNAESTIEAAIATAHWQNLD